MARKPRKATAVEREPCDQHVPYTPPEDPLAHWTAPQPDTFVCRSCGQLCESSHNPAAT